MRRSVVSLVEMGESPIFETKVGNFLGRRKAPHHAGQCGAEGERRAEEGDPRGDKPLRKRGLGGETLQQSGREEAEQRDGGRKRAKGFIVNDFGREEIVGDGDDGLGVLSQDIDNLNLGDGAESEPTIGDVLTREDAAGGIGGDIAAMDSDARHTRDIDKDGELAAELGAVGEVETVDARRDGGLALDGGAEGAGWRLEGVADETGLLIGSCDKEATHAIGVGVLLA